MAEQKSGVRVEGPNHSIPGGTALHNEGLALRVDEGHLLVADEDGKTIAIYAPGKWTRAEYLPSDSG